MPTIQFDEGHYEPPQAIPSSKQLLNNIVDGMAQIRPEAVWAKIPRNDETFKDSRKITYFMLANGVNGLAYWLEQKFGKSASFETLAYIGPWDPRYILLLLGAVKAGFKMVFPSAAYPVEGLSVLLRHLSCTKLLLGSSSNPMVTNLRNLMDLSVDTIPSLSDLLDVQYTHFPYPKTFATAKAEPLVVIHTSGTTGPPKPLVLTHDWAAAWIHHNQLPAPHGFVTREHFVHGIELCAVAPPNHSSSFFPNFFGALANDITVLYPHPNSPLNADTTMALIRHNDPYMLIAPSFILDTIASTPAYLEEASLKLSYIGFGGGPLSRKTGEILTERFKLVGMYGTSEMGVTHKIAPKTGVWDRGAWKSIMFHPKEGIELRKLRAGVEEYEAVVVKDTVAEDVQAVFKLFPEATEWSSRDVFVPDGDRPGFWIYQGRVDDILILRTGGTVNPVGYEQDIVAKNRNILAATVVGTGKLQVAIILEVDDTIHMDENKRGLSHLEKVEKLWPTVSECNNFYPPGNKVSKTHVIVTPKQKPLPRAPKGTIKRSAVLEDFKVEIEELYAGT